MSNKTKKIGEQRSFLNEPYLTSLTSHIAYSVEVTSYTEAIRNEGLYDYASIKFSISDCNRNIHLDFDIQTKEDMRNSLFKLDTIINICTALKEDLKTARKEVLKGQKRYNEIRKIEPGSRELKIL